MIPASQNQSAGGLLGGFGGFYNTNRFSRTTSSSSESCRRVSRRQATLPVPSATAPPPRLTIAPVGVTLRRMLIVQPSRSAHPWLRRCCVARYGTSGQVQSATFIRRLWTNPSR
jgi:hypothetical protein